MKNRISLETQGELIKKFSIIPKFKEFIVVDIDYSQLNKLKKLQNTWEKTYI